MTVHIDISSAHIGWIGTGVMGRSMAMNLLRAGWPLTVTTRTAAKAEPLIAAGAKWVDTARETAERSDIVFSMVGYPSEVEEVALGYQGVLEGFRRSAGGGRKIYVDMTTSRPELAEEIFQRFTAENFDTLDSPVSGGDIGAREGTLSIMIGGRRERADELRPIFSSLGQTIVYQGSAGAGQRAKLANQILIAGNMAGLCEALLFARSSDLDIKTLFASVEHGAAGSWSLSNLGPRILQGDFKPGFFVEHFVKDMEIALDEARRLKLDLPILAEVRRLYGLLIERGGEKNGTQVLIKALAERSGQTWLTQKT